MKKILSAIMATVVLGSTLVFTSSAADRKAPYTMEDVNDTTFTSQAFKGTPAPITAEGVIDPLWDSKEWTNLTYTTGTLPDGYAAKFKVMWDDDKFHVIVDVDDTTKEKEWMNDKVTISLFQNAAILTDDEDARGQYEATDLDIVVNRGKDFYLENKESYINCAVWKPLAGHPDATNSAAVIESFNAIKGDIKDSFYDDGTTGYTIQLSIPWIDKTLAKDKQVIGFNVSTENNDPKGNTYYASDLYCTSDKPLFGRPMILSAKPINMTEAASAVFDQISELPETVSLTNLADVQAKLAAIKSAYDALGDSDKALVSNYTAYEALKAQADTLEAAKAQIEAVEAAINAIPTEITLDDEAKIVAARTAFNALSDETKLLVSNVATLEDAEVKLAALKELANEQPKIEEFNNLVAALPENITLNDKEAVVKAREAYDALSPAAQELVTVSLAKLEAAESRILDLEEMPETDAVKAVKDAINAIPTNFTLDNEQQVKDARAAYDKLSADEKAMVTNLSRLEAAEKAIKKLRDELDTDVPKGNDVVNMAVVVMAVVMLAGTTVFVIRKRLVKTK